MQIRGSAAPCASAVLTAESSILSAAPPNVLGVGVETIDLWCYDIDLMNMGFPSIGRLRSVLPTIHFVGSPIKTGIANASCIAGPVTHCDIRCYDCINVSGTVHRCRICLISYGYSQSLRCAQCYARETTRRMSHKYAYVTIIAAAGDSDGSLQEDGPLHEGE